MTVKTSQRVPHPSARMTACPVCGSSDLGSRPERLRDSDTVGVLECRICRHVFLDDFSHVDETYYPKGAILENKPFVSSLDERLRHYRLENEKRKRWLSSLIINKRVLDFGCGNGQLLEMLRPYAKTVEGVEPTVAFREELSKRGVKVWPDLNEQMGQYDFIYSINAFEHIPNPVEELSKLRNCLAPNGLVFLEVPNLNNALVTLYGHPEATRFHYFLHHLHYYSRQSLTTLIERSGFVVDAIKGYQRFGLANHLYWLSKDKPGGHGLWSFLENEELNASYERALASVDLTDALVAQIRA